MAKNLVNSLIIFILLLYIILYFIFSKNGYTNTFQIIKKQISSILIDKKNRRPSDIIAFMNIYITPLILSIFISIQYKFNSEFYDETIIILAILVSVFLTLISILTSKSYKGKNEKQKEIIKYTFNNLYFITLLSISLIVMCFFANSSKYIISNRNLPKFLTYLYYNKISKVIAKSIITYLISEIIIHILIILKRIEQIFKLTLDD